MTPLTRALTAAALLALLLPAAAHAGGSIIGKWQMGTEEAGMVVEFSAGGVVVMGDQVGTYWTAGKLVTIDGWNGKTVTLEYKILGNVLTLTDEKGNDIELRRKPW